MKKRKKAVRLPYLVLVPFAASVCLVIWMIFSGALMSTDEATQSLGGIFDGTSAVHWPLIPNSPTLQPLIEVLLDTPEFFVMFWNTCILLRCLLHALIFQMKHKLLNYQVYS